MEKAQLQARRQNLIEQDKAATDHMTKAAIQVELSAVNAQLKALGAAEHAANMQRRNQREQRFHAAERKPTGLQTRGEFILMGAKRTLHELEHINPDSLLPHTKAFLEPLREFVAAQKVHVKEYRDKLNQTIAKIDERTDAEWRQVWDEAKP